MFVAKNKKGVSEVISTVLMILLVIVAVGAIAAFLVKFLRSGSDEVAQSQACLALDVNVKSCQYDSDANSLSVTVARDRGENLNIVELKVFAAGTGGENVTLINQDIPGLFESRVYSANTLTSGVAVASASVAAKLENTDGKQSYCAKSVPVSCSAK